LLLFVFAANCLQNLKQQLSPVQQYVQAQLAKLRGGSEAEKAEALKGLGERAWTVQP
jgi:hypothetical protein